MIINIKTIWIKMIHEFRKIEFKQTRRIDILRITNHIFARGITGCSELKVKLRTSM